MNSFRQSNLPSEARRHTGPASLKPGQFARIRQMLRECSGIDLREGKEQLVEARMGKFLRQEGFPDLAAFLNHLEGDPSGEALMKLVDVLTTNHTSFLREPDHFAFLRTTVMPWLIQRGPRPLRAWCAASSTGEEPYSILFTMLRAAEQTAWNAEVELLATDISRRVLREAAMGIYPMERLASLPADWVSQYFQHHDGLYRVTPPAGVRIRFERFNLMHAIPAGWRFPLIFCRNVMIYFDRDTQAAVVNRLAGSLEPGGYLFVGHAESLTAVEHPLEYIRPAIYRKPCEGKL